MDLSGAGTAIMLAIAAALWFLYLVPTWIRRREYLATERNATRIQQTMRVLAETAEVPDSVRIAATAREAARAERQLRAHRRRENAAALAPARGAISAPRTPVPTADDELRRQRMRRSRRIASALMIAATVVGLFQIWLMATTGVTLGSWLVLAATLAGGGVAIAMQRRLDARAMPRVAVAPAARPVRSGIPAALLEGAPARPAAPAPWTPVAVPPPLYRSRPPVQRVQPSPVLPSLPAVVDERPSAPVTPMRADPPAAARAKSGFAAMGIVDPSQTAAPDLDEVMRRRRTAG